MLNTCWSFDTKYLEIPMESGQHLSITAILIIITGVPLAFFHLYSTSHKVRYYFKHKEQLYRGISALGQKYQDKYIWTAYSGIHSM